MYKRLSDNRSPAVQTAALRASLSLAVSTFTTKKIRVDWGMLFRRARVAQLYEDQYVKKALSLLEINVRKTTNVRCTGLKLVVQLELTQLRICKGAVPAVLCVLTGGPCLKD